jgi:UDP-N-acetylglucosamine 2-epimerase
MPKIMTIVGTRPEIIKMSRVIAELDAHVDHVLVHTGQNYDYELNQVFFDDLEIRKPDYFLEAVGDNACKTIARVIEKSDELFEKENPDAVLFYGDTNSCLAVIAAKRRKIPVFHMEAGNRCFDQRVPEELNRKIVDHLSDINFVITEHARRYLIAEGVRPETIIKTGSHMQEILNFYRKKIERSQILDHLNLKSEEYFVFSAHREENVDSVENLKFLLETIEALAKNYNIPIIVSTHPRTKKRLDNMEIVYSNPLVKYLKPFSFTDYIKLQTNAFCVISDSGTLSEEASMLNLPAISIRNSHERPESMDAGSLIISGLKKQSVLEAVKIIKEQRKVSKNSTNEISDYKAHAVSNQIIRAVLSYIEYINRTVWFKF